MKKGIQKITYAVAEPKTFLVAVLDPGVEPVEFCVRMAERNPIPGLLPMNRQIEDGDVALYFDITGKRRIRDVIRESNEKQMIMLLSSLSRALHNLPDFFLRAGQCMLETDYTFADAQGSVWLPLIPMVEDNQDSNAELRSYFTELLGEYVPESGTPSAKVASLISAVIKPDFSLDSFATLLAPAAQPAVAASVRHEPVRAAGVVAAAAAKICPEETPKQMEEEKSKVGFSIPGKEKSFAAPGKDAGFVVPGKEKSGFSVPGKEKGSFSIPGREDGGFSIPGGGSSFGKKDKKKEKPEKEKKSFSLLGRKKDSKVDMNKEAHMVSGSVPERNAYSVPTPTPAYIPASVGPAQGGQWNGTVQLGNQGATEFMGGAGVQGAALLHNGRRVPLGAQTFTIGRERCTYVLDNPKVSRTHATIIRDGDRYLIQDENSSNHTYVNGIMIPPYTPVILENGSEIRLGSEELRFVQGNG